MRNRNILLSINVIDMIGLFIILPILPEMMQYYLTKSHALDGWLLDLNRILSDALPPDRKNDSILIAGGLAASIFSFMQFFSSPILGRWSDRVGRKAVLVVGSSGFVAAALLWYFADNFTMFFLSRALSGAACGTVSVGSAAMVDISTPEDRTRNVSLLGASFGVGALAGPVLASFLTQFHVIPPLASHPFALCALASIIIGLISVPVNLFLFTNPVNQIKAQPGSAYRIAFRIPWFMWVTFANFLFSVVYTGMEFFIPFYFKMDFGMGPGGIGLTFLYLGVLVVAGQGFLVPWLSKRFTEKQIAIAGFLAAPVPLVLFSFAAPNLFLAFAALLPAALAIACIFAGLNALASHMAPEESRGAAIGVFQAFFPLGNGFGPIVAGFLYWTVGIQWTCVILGCGFLGLGVLMRRVGKT